MAKAALKITAADHLLRGQLQHQLALSNKQISASQIYVRFVTLLGGDPSNFDLDDPVGNWINPWPAGAPAFINKANKFPPFKQDGLGLTLRDISSSKTIGNVGQGIVNRYRTNGWTIT